MLTILISILLISAHTQTPPEVIPVRDPNNIVISFGSCLNTFDESSDIDESIGSVIASQPDVWMWIGDAIYLDGDSFFFGVLGGAGYDVQDESYTVGVFNTLKSRPIYTQLMAATRIIGVWDDHDYAYDNANETFEYKQRNMGIYLDFVDEPVDSARRSQQGIYTSYYIGNETLVKVIMLDVRYNRDSESTTTSLLETDTTERFDDMLGEEQWAWLDLQLQDNTAPYTLLVSATQYLPDDRPIVPNWFRNSKDRILDLIRDRQKSGVILISGDVHYAEMIRHPCPNRVGYTNFYEFTSSGMTHSATFADIFDGIIPDTYSTEDDRYFEKNFGVLRFSRPAGSTDVPNLIFEARSIEGEVVLSREVVYSDLIFDAGRASSYNVCEPIDSDATDTDSSTSNDIIDGVQDVVGDENDGDGANGVIDDLQDVIGDENADSGFNGVVNDIQDVGNAIDDIFSKKK